METRRLLRILRYVGPYSLHLVAAVSLMAIVGLMEAFRLLLIGPILDRVLNPTQHPAGIMLFSGRFAMDLRDFVPHRFQNDWTVVAFALVASTLLKGVCDYAGTPRRASGRTSGSRATSEQLREGRSRGAAASECGRGPRPRDRGH